MSTLSIVTLIGFLVFFLVVGPALLYWFSRIEWVHRDERLGFIGFPEDVPKNHKPSQPSAGGDAGPESAAPDRR